MRWPLIAVGAAALVLGGAASAMLGRREVARADSSAARTIAVLPFENLSGDTSVVPLILGMHAEMVTQLTKLGGLGVASRNAALEYRGSRKTEREIARELGVAKLLTGSVQRAGDQVHFSVALTDAPNGKELWGESYDRRYTATNLFEVQGDIARQVATALHVQLTARQRQQIALAPTSNTDALNLYYRAKVAWENRLAETDSVVIRLLDQAVALDGGFVAAWSLLAHAQSWRLRRGAEHDTTAAFVAVQRARQLAPGSLEAVTAQAYYRYYAHGDFAGALRELEAADRLSPNSSEILLAMALLQRRLGGWDDAVALLQRASQLEPRNAGIASNLGNSLVQMRRPSEAARAIERALALAPNQPGPVAAKFELLESLGDTAGMRSLLESLGSLFDPSTLAMIEGRTAMIARDYPRALASYARRSTLLVNGKNGQRSYTLAMAAAASGDTALACAHADTLLRWARPMLAQRARRGPSDPLGVQALVQAHMAVAHAIRGEREEARRMAAAAVRYGLERDAIGAPDNLRMVALSYALTGRRPEAAALLARLLAVPSSLSVAELRMDPMYDGLRSEPEFQRLVGQ
jgi:serine/threonine-protein kinase